MRPSAILAAALAAAAALLLWGTTAGAAAATDPAALNPVPLRALYTAPNGQYLYTSDFAETVSARTQFGLTMPSQRAFAYVFRNSGPDVKPIYRLKKKSSGAWLVSASPSEINSLLSAGTFTSEGITGYVYSTPQSGAELLQRYSNANGWRLGFPNEDAALKAAGYKLDGPIGYALRSWYEVGAYYFGAWDANTNPNLLKAVQRLYGRFPDPWGGVRDFAGREAGVTHNTQGWAGDFSDLEPTIGYYDDSKPETLEKQIQLATAHGLSYFAFYEYWNNARGTPQYDEALKAFLAARNSSAMKFMLSPCIAADPSESEHLDLPESQFAAAAAAFAAYTKVPNYLTNQEGRPVIFMCDTRGIGDGSVAAANRFLKLLVADVTAASGRPPYLLEHSEAINPEAAEQPIGDGYTCLNINKDIVDGSYREYVETLHTYFTRFDAFKPTMRCGMSGFDERPRTNMSRPANQMRYFKDDSMSQFPAAMSATRADMQTAPATPVDNYLTLYAWNEWHEGGFIEPNVRDGDYFLRILQGTFGLTPRDASLPGAPPPPPPPPPTGPGGGKKRPVITGIKVKPKQFPVPYKPGSRAAARAGGKSGTTVSYHDSATARTKLTVLKRVKVKRHHGKTKQRGKGNRYRWVPITSFTHKDSRGENTVRFSGIVEGKPVKPGSYRIGLVPILGGLHGTAVRESFSVVRRDAGRHR